MEKETLYVTNADGKIVDIIETTDAYVKLAEGDKVLRKGTLAYLNDTVDVKYHFVKINPLVYGEISKKYSIINSLVKYLGYMDGKLQYRNGRPVKMKDIPKLCGVSEATAKRQIKGLFEADVIHKIRDKKEKQTYIVMNPYVAYIGKKIYLSLYEEFKLSEYRLNCEESIK